MEQKGPQQGPDQRRPSVPLRGAPGHQLRQGPFWRGEVTRRPAHIGRIEDEGAGDEFVQRKPSGAAGAGMQIAGQSPAGVERQAMTRHGQAAKEGLEAGERGKTVDVIDMREQFDDRHRRDDFVAKVCSPCSPDPHARRPATTSGCGL